MKVESKNSDVTILESDCSSGGGHYIRDVFLHPSEGVTGVNREPCNACLVVRVMRGSHRRQPATSDPRNDDFEKQFQRLNMG